MRGVERLRDPRMREAARRDRTTGRESSGDPAPHARDVNGRARGVRRRTSFVAARDVSARLATIARGRVSARAHPRRERAVTFASFRYPL
jgi:hypothetical protein